MPFSYPWAVEFAEQSEIMHWHKGEAKLQEDVLQWKTPGALSDIEKNHLTQILRLFTQSDVAVGGNYVDQFLPKFKNNEIRQMLLSFANREGEHQRAYALLLNTLGFSDAEFSIFLEYDEMSKKVEFMSNSDTSTKSGLGLALAKSAINEGMSLFSAFVMLLNYVRHGKMQGMCEIVAWSIKDEAIHVLGMTQLFRTYCEEHPRIVNDEFKKSIYDIVRQAVKLEDKFLELAYSLGEPTGLTKEEVKRYIRYIADRRLVQLGLKPNFKIKENPLDWVDWMISGEKSTSFFERTVTSYSKVGLSDGPDTQNPWGYPVVA